MKISMPGLKLVVAAIAATTLCHPALEAAADGQRLVVEIRGFEFIPDAPALSPGDVVLWRNRDLVPHTVTAEDRSWDSGLIEAGGEWEITITDDMIWTYYCRFHPSMIATINISPE